MKRNMNRLFAMALSCALLVSLLVPMAGAAVRASDYFSRIEIEATATGSGKVVVEFDLNATHTMEELGASKIYIWEKQSDGSYDKVKTYSGGMLEYNTAGAYGRVTYYGTSGVRYYATVGCYAKDSKGSQTLYSDSNFVTA